MRAICYKNTKTTLPNWSPNDPLEQHCPLGYAYETDGYFVHIYGNEGTDYTLPPGITVLQKNTNNCSLKEWVEKVFGAEDIRLMNSEVGVTHTSIWRPGLYFDSELKNGLGTSSQEIKDEEQVLLILLRRLTEVFLYIEPSRYSLNTYSHYLRDLLILSCTEFENQCRCILDAINLIHENKKLYNTKDYVKLNTCCFLREYSVSYGTYGNLQPFFPFKDWDEGSPTQSIQWYQQYNNVKHNRLQAFSQATLEAVLNAIAANVILFCVRFGPFRLFGSNSILSGYINQYIGVKLVNPDIKSFYVPLIKIKPNMPENLFYVDSYRNNLIEPWKRITF